MSIASLYPSINPSLLLDFANVKRLDPRITFTRTTTGTYYDGVTTAKAEENLLTYSQDFSNAAWTKLRSSVTADSTTAPDGTTTADSLIEDTSASDSHQTTQSITTINGSTYTYSVYIKPNGRTWAVLNLFDGTNYRTWFDLTGAGAVGTNAAGTTASITAVGTWYRCVITRAVASTSTIAVINLANADNSYLYTGNGTSGVYLWGAQLEQRSSATAYTATTSQAITNYIPVLQTASAGQARFDHNPTTGESLGLLIEEARTNLATYSAQFDNAAWTKSGGSITLNGNVAPDGTVSADIFVENTSNSTHELGQAFTINMTSTAYTMSIYVKANGRTRGSIIMVAPGPTYQQFGCNFNLTAQTATVSSANGGVASSATITPVGNDWYRITATGYTTYNGSQTFAFYLQDSSGNVVYTGNGFSGMSVWGAQLEAGSFATSYIPTTGSSATRNADAASMTGTNFSSWFNNANMSAYIEAATNAPPASTNTTGFSLNNGTLDRTNFFQSGGGSLGLPRAWFLLVNNGAAVVNLSGSGTTVTQSVMAKSALAIKTNDFAFTLNSATVLTQTSGIGSAPTQMNIGADYNASAYLNGTIKKLAYYPTRVTNAQLQALTV